MSSLLVARSLRLAAFTLLALALHSQAANELVPFVLPWDDATPGVTNISGWLDKPAGAHGSVESRNGHFFVGEKRIRFFGVNVAFGGNFPSHEDAEKVAARMAKFGINCVRFHHLDTGAAPAGLLQKDKRTLDPDALDRLDYFITHLKRNGIYTNLNLHVGNEYPGMPKWEGYPGYFKGVDNFYPPMIEQQRQYARALLTHVNRYTGLAYTADPAVALIEINNENGLIMEWNNRSLDNMPDPYAAEFRRQWNAWLTKRYVTQQKLATVWKEGEEPLGEEMLKDGRFFENLSNWALEQHEGAKASIALAGSELSSHRILQVQVAKIGREGWHVQFSQGGLKLTQGKGYTVSFQARSAKPRTISVNLTQTHDPWKVLASHQVKVGSEWQPYEVVLAPSDSEEGARLSISNLGAEIGEVSFGYLSLREGGVLALREGEQLGTIDFFRKSEIARRTLPAQRDWNRFLVDTEAHYWPEMARFIKQELKAKSLVLGSATGFSPWPVQAMLDVVDAHAYWQHPHFPHRPWDQNDWTIKNEPMAGAPDGGTLPGLALRRVAGKPFIVTEYNHAAPNTFSSEAFLEICAVAALQDWDGIFAFAYSHRLNQWDTQYVTNFFDIDQHPTKMATLPAALALFYRADITPPSTTDVALTSMESAIESIRTGGSWVDGRAYGLQREETFQHPIAMQLGSQEQPGGAGKPESPLLTSDNGQLTWDSAARRLLISTPRSAGVIGTLRAGEKIDLGTVKITPGTTRQDWATINVTVIEGDSFETAKRLLITATGDTQNTGMQWTSPERVSVGTKWGKAPSLVEVIPARITFPTGKASKLVAWPLDGRGQRKTDVPIVNRNGIAEFQLSPEHQTLWWEIEVRP